MTFDNHLAPETVNAVYPVEAITVYRNGSVLVHRANKLQGERPRGERRPIKRLSSTSLARLAIVAKETHITFETMITLTYGPQFPTSGQEVKSQLRIFLTSMRQHFGKFDYLWFLEFQRRGAPHIHVMTDLDSPTIADRLCMAECWVYDAQQLPPVYYSSMRTKRLHLLNIASLEVHIHRKSWDTIRSQGGAAHYVTKYATKTEQKEVPQTFRDVGRFWACSQRVGRIEGVRVDMSEEELRLILDGKSCRVGDWDVLPKYIYDVF